MVAGRLLVPKPPHPDQEKHPRKPQQDAGLRKNGLNPVYRAGKSRHPIAIGDDHAGETSGLACSQEHAARQCKAADALHGSNYKPPR